MLPIKTWTEGSVTIDFKQEIYEKLPSQYKDLTEFLDRLKSFNADIVSHINSYNINAHPDPISRGIEILGKDDCELGIFPNPRLALKCSKGKPCTENLRKQFYRSVRLALDFELKLNLEERSMLKICPVYMHFQTNKANSFFKQILFMQKINGETLGHTTSGFNTEFCRIFKLPTLEEISVKPQFRLHLCLDKSKKRQLLKIQTVYLYRRLLRKGINILSLNQKNILATQNFETAETQYVIIDPTVDFFMPVSPIYNALTNKLCT
jgi:hypothetical protein